MQEEQGKNKEYKRCTFLYAMGRTGEIWGEDCLQYKQAREMDHGARML
jgi:hypothetical protein